MNTCWLNPWVCVISLSVSCCLYPVGLSISHAYQISDVGLTLGNTSYDNNSIVTRRDIGTGSAALLCTTTRPGCCSSANQETQWYFPNGSQVQNNRNLPYYRIRNNPDFRGVTDPLRSVQLHRNPEGTTTGIFHCVILDANGTIQNLYVGIYDGESCTLSEYSWLFARTYQALQTRTINFKCFVCNPSTAYHCSIPM